MANTSVGDFFSDAIRGMGAGLMADPSGSFRSLGASMLGGMASSEEDKNLKKKSDADYENWLRKYTVTSKDEATERADERQFKKSEMSEQREYASQEAENAVERALRQLTQSLEIQRRAKASEREDLRSERGKFNPMSIDNLLYDAFGKNSPRYTGSPRSGTAQPTMAWGGGSIS